MTRLPVLPQKFPYNEMLLNDQRQFETRNWSWSYRGPLLFYTSSTNVNLVCKAYDYDPKEYEHQVIVAKAVLFDVRELTNKEKAFALHQLNPDMSKAEICDFVRYGLMEDNRIFPGDYGFFFCGLERIKPRKIKYPRGAINVFWLNEHDASPFQKFFNPAS